jgi:hypothetical protein
MELTIKRRPDLLRHAKLRSVFPPLRGRVAVTVIVMVTAILGMLLLQGTSRMATI